MRNNLLLQIFLEWNVNTVTLDNCSPNSSSFCWSGVLISSVSHISVRILPMAVLSPVPMTTPRALPAATFVPLNRMFFLSWFTARGSGTGSLCLITDTDSPVRIDWSIRRVVDKILTIRISAGILSPTVYNYSNNPLVIFIYLLF